MPQVQLPLFPSGTTVINGELAFERREEQVVYFNGHLPVFTHGADDLASFRLFTTQLIVNGTATQGQIVRAFGVPLTTVKRSCRAYRERGAAAFFKPPARRAGSRLTPERLAEAQRVLDQGERVPQISAALDILPSTLHKALDDGRLRGIKKKPPGRGGAEQPLDDQERAQRGRSTGRAGGSHDAGGGTDPGLAGQAAGRADPV